MARRNIEIILGGLAAAVRNQDPEHITEFLAADLVWEGLAPGLRCDGRKQAMSVIRNRFAARRSPLMPSRPSTPGSTSSWACADRGSTRHWVIWTRWARSTTSSPSAMEGHRWRDYLTREQALAAAGAIDPHWQ
jgi:hypothetical protein